MERLRSLARSSADVADPWDDSLVIEAAAALATMHADPSLVVACRRMLAHHRTSASLWWLLAHVLASPNPGTVARERRDLFESDPTAEHLASSLPLLNDAERIGVVGWGRLPDLVFADRIDLDVVAITVPFADPVQGLRRSRLDREIPVIEPFRIIDAGVQLIVLPALAITPDGVLFGNGIADILFESGSIPIWVVAGVGTVLPIRLGAAIERAASDDSIVIQRVPIERFARIVGPKGAELPAEAIAGFECPIPAELLKPL